METILIFLAGFWSGLVATLMFELILKTNKNLRKRYYRRKNIIFGYHVHHSCYSFPVALLGVIFLLQKQLITALFAFGFAVGIVAMHTISEKKFVFIDKQRDKT